MSEMVLSADYKTAVELDQRIKTTAKALAENLFELCGLFYKMSSEKLYKELGYQNFAEYCENEVGITRQQGQKYSKIGEGFLNENGKSTFHFENLGTEKLYLLAKLDEPEREEIQQNVNIEDVSVKELKAEIEKLKEENKKIRSAKISVESDLLSIKSDNRSLRHSLSEANESLDEANKKITELESRPIEVAVQEDKTAKAVIRDLNRKLSEADQDHVNEVQRIRREYQNQINDLSSQLTEMTEQAESQNENIVTVKVPDVDAILSPCISNLSSAVEMLIKALEEVNDPSFIKETEKKVDDYRWKIDGIFDTFDIKFGA